MATKKERLKQIWHDRKEDVIAATVVIGGVATAIGFAVKSHKDDARKIASHKQRTQDTNEWLVDEHNSGNSVYQLYDGVYLKVPNDSKSEIVIK